MPDPIDRALAMVADQKVDPAKRAKVTQWLGSKGVDIPVPKDAVEEQPQGMDYTQYTVPKSGAEAMVGDRVTTRSGVARAKFKTSETNNELPTASKRVSLAAEPYYAGKDEKWSQSPFTYYEPKPENIVSQLEAYKATLPDSQRRAVDEDIASVAKLGKDSPAYKEFSDKLWLETLAGFKEAGLPVQRLAYAPADGYRTAVNKAAGNVAAPILYGADQMMAFGLGSALWPTAAQDVMSGTSPEQDKVLAKLRERGVLPEPEDARGQEYDPVLSTLGGVFGLVAGGPKTAGGQAAKAGLGVQSALAAGKAPAFLQGTSLAARLAKDSAGMAAGGAVGSGLAGAGSQLVTEGFEAAHGQSGGVLDSAGDVLERAGGDALVGGVASPVLGGLGAAASTGARKLGEAAQNSLRTGSGLAEDLRALEAGGGKTSILSGAKRSPDGQALAEEALTPTKVGGATLGTSQQQAGLKPLADSAVDGLQQRIAQENQAMEAASEAGYQRLKGVRIEPFDLFNRLLPLVKSRKDVPFAELSRYREALTKMSDVKPMKATDPALQGRARFTAQEVRDMGLDPDAMLREAFKKELSGVDEKNIVWSVIPKKLSAKEIDDATRGLAAQIKWGKDAGSKDREMRSMYEALVRTRKRFGESWSKLKADHDEILSTREEDLAALNLGGKELSSVGDAERTAAFNAWSEFGKPSTAPSRNQQLMKTVRHDPRASRRAQAHASNAAYDQLPTGLTGWVGGGSGGLAGMVKGAAGATSLRMDPVFGAMRSGGRGLEKASATPELRQKLQQMLGPGVEIPDSVLSFAAQLMSTVRATENEK